MLISRSRTYTAATAAARPPLVHNANDAIAPELDCVRHIFSPAQLRAVTRRAHELGTGADQVLIHQGLIDEASYLKLFAAHTGLAIEPLRHIYREDVAMTDDTFLQAAACGAIAIRERGELIFVCTLRGGLARRISLTLAAAPQAIRNIRLTTTAALENFYCQHGGPLLAQQATRRLHREGRSICAALPRTSRSLLRQRVRRAAWIAALMLLPPIISVDIASALLAILFIAFYALRLAGCLWPRPQAAPVARLRDDELPIYTVMAAVYREASSIKPLLRGIAALDYPGEKLDVILAVELDDLETRAAIARERLPHNVRVIIATSDGPKTKPKALNYALPFARGAFVTVLDAEDRPAPDQLRGALATFRRHGDEVACAQASLCIDNETHSLLSRMFAVEYAGQFDVYLPGLAAMRLPLSLGGSSNHFRTRVLREVGCWDAYNVTEDADLGYRLARYGYRSEMFASSTYEEAPLAFTPWLKQRSRWMKGWMQTWHVHMRHPLAFLREAGLPAFLAMNVLIGGNVLSALAFPVFIVALADGLSHLISTEAAAPMISPELLPLHVMVLLGGLASTISTGLMGLEQRRRLKDRWILAYAVPYWACLSLAAWRALFQFIWSPSHWEKTPHGIARRPDEATAARPEPGRALLRNIA